MRNLLFFSLTILFAGIAWAYDAKDLFELLPDKQGWRRLSRTLKNDAQVPKYVRIYSHPFRQLQTSARNDTLGVGVIKRSVLMALHLSLETSKSFVIRKRDFKRRDMKDIRSMIKKALTTFDLRKAEKLHPVFDAQTLKAFMEQRFEDMFFANTDYSKFRDEKGRFEKKLRQLHAEIKRTKGVDLRHLTLITADIKEMEKRTVKNLIFFRNDIDNVKKQEDFQKAEERVKKLGSPAVRLEHLGSWTLACAAVLVLSMVV